MYDSLCYLWYFLTASEARFLCFRRGGGCMLYWRSGVLSRQTSLSDFCSAVTPRKCTGDSSWWLHKKHSPKSTFSFWHHLQSKKLSRKLAIFSDCVLSKDVQRFTLLIWFPIMPTSITEIKLVIFVAWSNRFFPSTTRPK